MLSAILYMPETSSLHCMGCGQSQEIPKQVSTCRATQLRPGDRVEFRRVGDGRSGVEIKVDGENVLLMREDDVIGKYAEAQA